MFVGIASHYSELICIQKRKRKDGEKSNKNRIPIGPRLAAHLRKCIKGN